MSHLKGSKDLVPTLEADNLDMIKWFVDLLFAVHNDIRGHTGGAMTLGKGAVTTSYKTSGGIVEFLGNSN